MLWYAVQIGDYEFLDYGSHSKEKAMEMARQEKEKNPTEKVTVAIIDETDGFCLEMVDV